MNKVYKVIWSKVRNCYVVVSELAKRNGKNTGTTDKRRKVTGWLALAAMAVALNLGTTGMAEAGNIINTNPGTAGTSAPGDDALAGGSYAFANGKNDIAVGSYATTGVQFTLEKAQAWTYDGLQETIKNRWNNGTWRPVRNATDYDSLVAALEDIVNGTAGNSYKNAARQYLSQLNEWVTAYQNSGVSSGNSVAMGNHSTVTGGSAVAIGDFALAAADKSIAIGVGEAIYRDIKAPGTYHASSTTALSTIPLSKYTLTGAYGEYDIAIGKAAAHGERNSYTTFKDVLDDVKDGVNVQTDIGGYYSDTGGNGKAIAVGYDALAVRQHTIAVGTLSMAAGADAIAVGRNARALTPNSVVIGGGDAGGQGIQGNGAIHTPNDLPYQGGNSITIGNAANFTFGSDSNDDYYANTKNSIAIGYRAHTHAANAFAIGVSTDATAERSFAIGTSSTDTYAAHRGARAGGQGSIAFGDQAVVSQFIPSAPTTTEPQRRSTETDVNDAIAVGTNSFSQARNAIAVGGGMSYTYHNVHIDDKTKEITMTNKTLYYTDSGWQRDAEGTGARVGIDADGGVAIGGATATVEPIDNPYFPTELPTVDKESYTPAATIGDNAKRAVAIGSGASIGKDAENSVAVGARNIVTGKNSTAVGQKNQVAGDSSGAFGDPSYVSGDYSYSIGHDNKVGYIDPNVENGKSSLQHDKTTSHVFVVGGANVVANAEYINVLGSKNEMIGTNSKDVTIIGNENKVVHKLTDSLIAGNKNENTNAEGENLVILGNQTNVTTKEKIDSAIAIGQATTIGANYTIAIGKSAQATMESSTALGNGAQATNKYSTALGTGAHATMESSTALGNGAQASIAKSIALGSSSVTDGGTGAGNGSYSDATYTIGGAAYQTNFAAKSSSGGVISIGTIGQERRIQNVAAGKIASNSTDAINGSQLYAAYQDLQWKAGVSKNGGKVSGEVPQQVIGDWDGSPNKGVVNFKAGKGIEIATANSGSLDMTFKLDPAALPVVTVNGGTPAPSNGTYSSDGNLNIKSTTDVPTGRTTYDIKLADKVTLGGNYINQVTLDGTTGKVTVGDKINMDGNTGIARIGDVHINGQSGRAAISGLSNTTWDPNITYTGGYAATQEQLQTVQNNLQWNIGTGTTETSTPSFLKPVGGDKHNVVIREGEGIRIDASERMGGYDIVVNSDFTELTTTVPGGRFIDSITYKGQEYFINGGSGGGTVDVVSDNRAVIMAAESEDVKDDLGQVIGRKHYIKLHSPYINVHGLNGTEFHDEPQDYFAKAEKTGALAIGIHSKAAEENSTAIGHNADAMAAGSTAIGYNSHAHGDNSVAVGLAATTSGNRAISIGTSASHTSNEDYNPTNPHQGARAAGQGTIVLGDRAMAISSEYQADNTYVEKPGPDYTVNDAIAIGTRAQARARNGIALGGNTSYTYYDEENKQYVTVYGADDDVLGGRNNGAEVGDNAVSGIAIGGAYGKFNEDTKTIHQEMDAAATFGIRGIAIGSGALVANPDDFADLKEALSDPSYVKIKRDFLTARSNHLEAKADWDAIKDLTVNDPSMPEGMRITQVKYDAAREKYERTLKVMNDATAKYSMALKEVVRLQAKDAVLEEDAIAIGTLSNASIKDSVALGSKSITDANDKAGSRTGMSGYDPLGKASNNDLFRGDNNYSEDDPVWRSTAGSLSVGGTYYKKDDNGGYVTDADGNLVVDEVITRRISHVAAGIKDSDAVNVAQLKRATTLSSDGRNTALGIDESGNIIVNSPFLAISGVQESSDNNSIVRKYRNDGGADGYVKGLQAESTEIEGRIASIKKTQSDIDKALNGYYDNNGNFVDGIEQQYAKRQNLEKQFKDGQITPEKYLEESAKLITETDYRAHKMEYTDQLTATNERLSALNDSKQEYDELLANNGEKAKTKYKEAETFFNSQANASGTDSMALGKEAKAGGKQSVVLGTGNEVGTAGDIDNNDSENVKANREKEATRSIAIGSNNKIKGNANTESSTDSIAFGTDNEIYGSQNTAIGTGHKMYGEKSGTMGDPNVLAANYSYVIGNDNTIGNTKYENGDEVTTQNIFIMGNENVIPEGQNHVYVLGSNVNTTTDHSVFLGDHSGYVEDDGTTTKGTTEGYKEATVSGIKFGDFAGGDENQVAGVVSVGGNVDGVMTTRRIQNVAPGLITAESTDAINGSQLYAAIKALTVDVKGDGTTTDVEKTESSGGGGGSTAATTYTVKGSVTTAEGSDNITVTDTKKEENDPKSYNYKVELNPEITVDSVTAGTGDNKTVLNKDGLVINDGPSVKKNGIDAAGTTITNVGSGLGGDSNAANISDVKALTTEVADGDNTTVTSETDDNGRKTFKVNLKKDVDLTKDGSMTTGDTKVDNNGVTIANGPSMTATDGFKYGTSTLNDTGLTVGNATVQDNKIAIDGGPSMTKDGIDAGGKKITNVADAEDDGDAVNYGQLKNYAANNNQAMTNLGNQITNVDSRARKGIAGAAALAALHPMDFDPDDKLTFAAGMGHYRGENAAALGLFYRPDEKVMFSLGGTVGNGENMVNAGVSFSLDRTPRVTGSRTALTKEVVHLREQVARQDAQIAKQDQQIAMQGAQIAQLTALVSQLTGVPVAVPSVPQVAAPTPFPDNLDNKWAYDVIEDLEQRGYFTGYAGRELTRDEFAAALDRAMAGGAKLEERIIREFEPELSHVRVAHVEGKGNNEGEWYERPRASHDKYENKHEIAKKYSRVQEKKVTSKS